MPELDPAIRAYYDRGAEAGRLTGGFPSGPLELERTRELILRSLPDRPLQVLDVGGGAGIHAGWLAGLGHDVQLIDPVPLHVEQALATGGGFAAEVGDARALPVADGSVDVVLLLGPLYHLLDAGDRALVLDEARRVLRPQGLLFAAAIARFAALLDMLVRLDSLHADGVMEAVAHAVRTGEFHGARHGLFTNAYFHLPDELRTEITDAGFVEPSLFNIEGPGFLVNDFEQRWVDPDRKQAMLDAARLVESEPAMLAAASHLLAVAQTNISTGR